MHARVTGDGNIALQALEAWEEQHAYGVRLASCIAGKVLPPITKMELFVTEDCNLRCDYCFVKGKNVFNSMTWDTARKAIDMLFRLSRERTHLEITFFGGEPLMELDLLEEVMSYSRTIALRQSKTVEFVITTNATLLNERALMLGRRYGFLYLLSVDGDAETHDRHRKFADGRGSFSEVIIRVPLVKAFQGWLGTRMTVTPQTSSRLFDNFRYLVGLGFNQFLIGPASDQAWEVPAIKKWYQQMMSVYTEYREMKSRGVPLRLTWLDDCHSDCWGTYSGLWGCEAGVDKIAISSRGEIYPCVRFLTVDNLSGALRMGTVEEGIIDFSPRVQLALTKGVKATCRVCPRERYCSGGCPAVNLEQRGDLFAPSKIECAQASFMAKVHRLRGSKAADAAP